ncbi:hypothetical protein SPRG_01496 [Saprolegnia parasitica CBS 223.65]|uniref:Disease resistance R13L4/SHOC-2-like LRR domain-containing protein n=1 Tax=Saprolegnia parasitica (strain CBS 223.65) TaxID=695850 RepID=A0A067CYM4_SAPPC|nr:hypothetical protein SPRG_01496 [Saprolegnia parasitica CBS 223.65]KDO34360.1 hypothetical protein SPRG_01496 [Saprolegnia parasitica CBS 223.65]|eukprot:XP_012195096.1 hypothetical protein SPRG_01496 [Saprolegnia parasitica CBS 223.65]
MDPTDPTTTANAFPFDELCGDNILYMPPDEEANARQRVALKAPVLNIHKEYAASGSYEAARATIHAISTKYEAKVLSNNERYLREQKASQYKTKFLETRLATTGPPTLNTMAVLIDRRRDHADAMLKYENDADFQAQEKTRSIQTAMCRSYGSGTLDLKALHIDMVPDTVFSTFLLQMARFIKEINISRNEFRDISTVFCAAFPSCEWLNATENNLISISRDIGRWNRLHTLLLDCNKLDGLPETLPSSLQHVSVARNRLRTAPCLYRLVHLVTLDLSHNLLVHLPNALYELHLLRTVSSTTSAADWSESVDPASGTLVYYNHKTKTVTRKRPDILGPDPTAIPKLRLQLSPNQQPVETSTDAPPLAFPGGWEILPGARTSYRNHMTNATFTSVPPELDRYDRFTHIKTLNVANNSIDELPISIGHMQALQVLNVGHNRLWTLPDALCQLANLTHLLAPANCITSLPDGFVHFPLLQELDLKLNRLSGLPPNIGKLATLTVLDVSSNQLERVPGSVLQLRQLTTLRLTGNPSLVVPSATAQAMGLPSVFAEIQNQIFVEARGAPPEPHQVQAGIFDECVTTDLHVHREIMELIAAAKTTHVLDFHWRNLATLPPQLFELSKLQELRLTGHNLGTVPPQVALLPNLRLLNLRQNRLRTMDASCVPTPCPWEELDLENNSLPDLPATLFAFATKLRVLRVGCNLLEAFPPAMDALTQLEICLAPHNHLQSLPASLARLPSLRVLDVSNNRIAALDSFDFRAATGLREFKANRNLLSSLPASIASACLHDLSLSGNQFESFPLVACGMRHLKRLWMQSNKLQELPVEFGGLQTLEMVEFEGNPLRSPPPSILAQGIGDIQVYLQKRVQRVLELQSLLSAVPYGFNREHFVPRTQNLLTTNLAFLTPEDLLEFDGKVDKYVNGAFFQAPSMRGVDLVQQLQATQHARAQTARKAVLEDVLQLCRLIQTKRWLDKVDFRYDLTRPWGLNAEETPCYMLNPTALYEDWEDVPSILHVIEKRVGRGFKDEAFPHAPDVVVDALTHYEGVYGPVGIAHHRVPFRCGCEVMLRKGTAHDPCYKFAWVLVQSLTSHEEAARRVNEDAQIEHALKEVRAQVHSFLTTTRDGKARLFKEAKLLKAERKARKKRIRRQLPGLKKAIGLRKADLVVATQKNVLDKTIAGDAWTDENAKAAEALVKAIEEDIAQQEEHIKDMEAVVKTLQHELRQTFNHYVTEIVEMLLSTTGKEIRERIVTNQRTKAIRKQLRRPWDAGFEVFKAQYLGLPRPPSPRNNSELSDVIEDDLDDDYDGSAISSVVSSADEADGKDDVNDNPKKDDAAADPNDSDDSDI